MDELLFAPKTKLSLLYEDLKFQYEENLATKQKVIEDYHRDQMVSDLQKGILFKLCNYLVSQHLQGTIASVRCHSKTNPAALYINHFMNAQ